MREIYITEKDTDFCLGKQGENLALCVHFDVTNWPDLYGSGYYLLLNQRSADDVPYIVYSDGAQTGNYMDWNVSNADTAYAGYGKCELQYIVNETLAKSLTFATFTIESLGDGVYPDPTEEWRTQFIEDMEQIHADAQAATSAASTAAAAASTASSAVDTVNTKANEASQSAADAAIQATAAANSATESAGYVTLASEYAFAASNSADAAAAAIGSAAEVGATLNMLTILAYQNSWVKQVVTATLTNTLDWPFNDSEQTVALINDIENEYLVFPEIPSDSLNVGEVKIYDKLVNGFKAAYTGSASSCTITFTILGGVYK